MFSILQLLLVVALIIGVIIYFGKIKQKEKSLMAGLLVCIVLAAIISNGILNLVPLPTNEVVITATGEKNENAKNNEVNIINYIVSGEEYAIKNPTEGKWFWKGDVYMWRNENDSRQPAGTTRSITLNIPYGQERAIQFGLSEWNGIVEVTYNGESNRYDLFKSGDEKTFLAPVPDTDSFALYSAKLLRLLLFAAIICLLVAYPVFCVIKYDYEVIKKFWQKHWDKLYYLGLAVLYVLLLQKNSVGGSLWGDEIWELGWKYTNKPYFQTIVYFNLTKFWLWLMPYGHQYLLLLPQLFVAGTIFLAGCIGNRLYGKWFGLIFSSLVAFSLSIVYQCSMEYRVYAFMLFSTALVFYTFIRKQEHLGKETFSDIILHGVAITILMDMHTFGVAAACLMMFGDFILILLKKTSKKSWFEFVLPGLYGFVWLFAYVFKSALSEMNNYASWMNPPGAERVISTLTWLMGSSSTMFYLLVFAVIVVLIDIIFSLVKKQFEFKLDYINLMALFVPTGVIGVVFIYSTIINPGHPLFFDRYFISVLFFMLYITALGIYKIVNLFEEILKNKLWRYYLVFSFIVIMCISCWPKVGPWEIYPAADHTMIRDYKSAVEYIMEQNDIYCADTFFAFDHNDDATIGLQYYITHKGTRDMINYDNSLPKDLERYNTVYYSYVNQRSYNSIINSDFANNGDFVLQEDNKDVKVFKFVRVQN